MPSDSYKRKAAAKRENSYEGENFKEMKAGMDKHSAIAKYNKAVETTDADIAKYNKVIDERSKYAK